MYILHGSAGDLCRVNMKYLGLFPPPPFDFLLIARTPFLDSFAETFPSLSSFCYHLELGVLVLQASKTVGFLLVFSCSLGMGWGLSSGKNP